MNDYFYFMIEDYPKPFGYLHRNVVIQIPWTDAWSVDHDRQLLTLRRFASFDERTAAMQATLKDTLEARTSLVLEPWADELFPLYAADGEHVLDMDSCGQDLFGMRVQGVHVTVWTETDQGRMYWVQRRSLQKTNHAGMLDTATGGGLRSRERAIVGMVRELEEEACLPQQYSREHIRPCGTLSYTLTESSMRQTAYQPHTQFVFEMEVASDVVLRPGEEVDSFELMTYEQVRAALERGDFKPVARMVWIAHFIRHGYLNAETEPNLPEICARLNRKHAVFMAP